MTNIFARITRLTNAFSKKVDNHKAAIALHFMHYNFGRIHKTLRVTPAMEAGAAAHVWSHAEIAQLARMTDSGFKNDHTADGYLTLPRLSPANPSPTSRRAPR